MPIDLLVVGAGPVGCTVAERAATELGWSVLLLDKRDHIGGNCYDEKHESGVLIHKYGPHLFRTNDQQVLEYLSRFTEWLPREYIARTSIGGKLYPFPINLTTLELFFEQEFTPESAAAFLEQKRMHFDTPSNSEEFILSRVGPEIFHAFYEGYTRKQWGREACELDPSVCGRVPIRLNRDERYVSENFQQMPKHGYTSLFENMIDHDNISLQLKSDYFADRSSLPAARVTVYTGPIDQYFDFSHGRLPWRSLYHEFVHYKQPDKQHYMQINYPNEHDYTRSIEFKHLTGQLHPDTMVAYEYSRAEGDPFYPVPNDGSAHQYKLYKALAEQETKQHQVYFAGRLANYTYINMDQAFRMGLDLFESIRCNHS